MREDGKDAIALSQRWFDRAFSVASGEELVEGGTGDEIALVHAVRGPG